MASRVGRVVSENAGAAVKQGSNVAAVRPKDGLIGEKIGAVKGSSSEAAKRRRGGIAAIAIVWAKRHAYIGVKHVGHGVGTTEEICGRAAMREDFSSRQGVAALPAPASVARRRMPEERNLRVGQNAAFSRMASEHLAPSPTG